ncbi:hypothetical protein [Halorussus ruber]|uniref:hypothetical protein n=1 Tax=Halorussus ruber TaxID=1126238 RepID=UPI001FE6D747|nr:hypothetical protein [Halorussus ruber]
MEGVLAPLGPVGRLVDLFLAANLVLIGLLVAVSVPLYVFVRDVRKTLRRFGLARSERGEDVAAEGATADKPERTVVGPAVEERREATESRSRRETDR